MSEIWLWGGFLVFVFIMLALDLGVFNKKDHVVSTKEALSWTAVWVFISLCFNVLLYFMYEGHWFGIGTEGGLNGKTAAVEFFTGYLIEKSLSLDNIFVIALIFGYFKVPAQYQHRVLFWGILGALIMRGVMIAAGAAMIKNFSWTVYVFGAFLIITAIRMLRSSHEEVNPDNNWLVKIAKRFYRVSAGYEGHDFFTKIDGKRAMTPLFLVLLVVESSDVLFAVDSIPAIFAVTNDPYIVFTSNIFAILGLRSLYFALASLLEKFRYLKESLVVVLAYVGAKMIASHHFPIPAWVSLLVIVGVLALGVVASIVKKPKPPLDEDEKKAVEASSEAQRGG
jgi:tellurite resistance protein TerC